MHGMPSQSFPPPVLRKHLSRAVSTVWSCFAIRVCCALRCARSVAKLPNACGPRSCSACSEHGKDRALRIDHTLRYLSFDLARIVYHRKFQRLCFAFLLIRTQRLRYGSRFVLTPHSQSQSLPTLLRRVCLSHAESKVYIALCVDSASTQLL